MKRKPAASLRGNGTTLKACKFPSSAAKSTALAEFMRKHGDGLPDNVIKAATASNQLGQWTAYCDDQGEVGAAMRRQHTDWYLCTLKNAAVRPDLRGRGLASKLYTEAASAALADTKCLVLAADVTDDNVASVKALKRAGFEKVDTFCWEKGEKPADIMHFVKLPPKNGRCE